MTLQADPRYVFERSSDEYARLTRQAALIEPMTERLFRNAGITPGMRVLDVGSGVGDVALLAARLRRRCRCRRFGSADRSGSDFGTGLDNLTFIEGDVRSADTGTHFDAAVGRLVLAYLANPAEALRAIADCVRPGGMVAFQELDLDPGVSTRSFPTETLWDQVGQLVISTPSSPPGCPDPRCGRRRSWAAAPTSPGQSGEAPAVRAREDQANRRLNERWRSFDARKKRRRSPRLGLPESWLVGVGPWL